METWNKIKDVVLVLLIPVIGWIVSTQSDNAVQQVRIRALEAQMQKNSEGIQLLRETDNRFEVHFARIEGRLDRLESRLESIHTMLQQHNQAHGLVNLTSSHGGGHVP